MPLDYTLLTLPCWQAGCPERFDVFTDLSNHHLRCHERPLERYAVTDLVARTLTADVAPEAEAVPAPDALCTCGCVFDSHRLSLMEGPGHPCLVCYCPAFALASAHPTLPAFPAELSALLAFRHQCEANYVTPCDALGARLLLERLGVPPDAPAVDFASAIDEAVQRWCTRAPGTIPAEVLDAPYRSA